MVLCGDHVLKQNMDHRTEVGSLLILEVAMELVFGSILQKRLNILRKTVCLNWGMVGKSDFGKTLGVGDNLYVMLSLASIAQPVLKGLRLLRFG